MQGYPYLIELLSIISIHFIESCKKGYIRMKVYGFHCLSRFILYNDPSLSKSDLNNQASLYKSKSNNATSNSSELKSIIIR